MQRIFLIVTGSIAMLGFIVFAVVYGHFAHIVDVRLSQPVFERAAQIYGVAGPDSRPQLITAMATGNERSKRRILQPNQIPKMLSDAIISVEDRRFFEHRGINWFRLGQGLLAPVLKHERMQGGSTLTMQMARSLFLSGERTASRKFSEILIATELERRFTKEQILAIYVNQVDLGQHGSFDIRGFGEAARVYFGKDVQQLNLPETALLAGLVNGPSYFSPYRHPDRAIHRRNLVLAAMVANGKLSREAGEAAKAAPLKLASPTADSEAPYFSDALRDGLNEDFEESDLSNGGLKIYTGLDLDLQRIALRVVSAHASRLDKMARHSSPQIALVALDPHTGDVLAMVGGRSYSDSQLNHALQKRPTGSIFKPFVYAAAIASHQYTQISEIDSAEGDFPGGEGAPYHPHNFDAAETAGPITLRSALAHSVNTATVRLASQLGYQKICQLAQNSGIDDIKPTPSMAIGTYSATPLAMASAYTVFANGGNRLKPRLFRNVADANGEPIQVQQSDATQVLDPAVASVLTNMMQDVLVEGTASHAVSASLQSVSAGKTGTSHDAWFAGYTSNLLCVIWVGNDDYSNLNLEGAKAAAPLWNDLLTQARRLPRFRNMQPWSPVNGVTALSIDRQTNLPATSACPDDYQAWFLSDALPRGTCEHPDSDGRNIFQRMFGLGKKDTVPTNVPGPPQPENQPKKKGFWHRLFGNR